MVTRITNTMLTNTLLSNLSMNLGKMDKLQNQLSSGRKFGHISDDPSALIYGQAARNKLARLGHYMGAVETAQSWLTQAEAGVMELNKVVGAIYEELVSAGSVKTPSDKQNLAKVVGQLRDHYVDTLNTSYGDRFVFGGYNTPGDYADGRSSDGVKPFAIDPASGDLLFNGLNVSQFDRMPSQLFTSLFRDIKPIHVVNGIEVRKSDIELEAELTAAAGSFPIVITPASAGPPPVAQVEISLEDAIKFNRLYNDNLSFDVAPGVSMPVTANGLDVLFYTAIDDKSDSPTYGLPVIRNMFSALSDIYEAINAIEPGVDTGELTKMIKTAQDGQNHLLTRTAEIGGRQRRLELLEARFTQDNLNYEKMRSDAEDADMAEVIMYLKMAETVYQAALSAGARVIQPTLMDFLR